LNDFIFKASVTYLATSPAVQVLMNLDWTRELTCYLIHYFDELQEQAMCEFNNEILELHPLALHVHLQETDSDDPTYRDILNSDPKERPLWYDAMDAELEALHEKRCYNVVP